MRPRSGLSLIALAGVVFASGCGVVPAISVGPAVVAVHRVGVARFHVSAGVVDLAVTGRTVWVAGFGAVTRLDPVTGATVARIETPGVGDRSSIAAGERGVWVSAADRGVVYRIATDTDRVVAAIHVGGLISAVAVGGGQVWVTRVTQTLGNVVRIDPRTDQVAGDPITVGPGPDELVYAHAAVWVANTSPPSVMRIDPRTGRVATVPEIGVLGAGFGSLWAASGNYVTRFDPGTGRIEARWYIARASGLAFGGGDVWVLTYPRSDSPTVFNEIARTAAVWELDPSTNRVAPRPLRLAALEPIAIGASATNVCVGDYATATVTSIRIAQTH